MKYYLYLFFFVFALMGCAEKETLEEFLVKETIKNYTRVLIEAYKTGNPGLFKGLAAEKEIRKRDIMISSWLSAGEYMDADLKKLKFKEVKITSDTAVVKTSEKWTFQYRDVKTEEVVDPQKTVSYEMAYTLVKEDGRWLVSELRIDKERIKK
mgnify:FL=1